MRSSLHAASLVGALVCATSGCGRLGFDFTADPAEISAFEAGVAGRDGAVSRSDAAVARSDAAVAPRDAGVVHDDASGAALDASVANDASIVMRDGAVPMDAASDANDARTAPLDAGREVDARVAPDTFCTPLDDALFCADFSALPSPVDVKERGGRISLARGTLSVTTTEAGGSAAISGSFAPVHEGTLYARFLLRVPRTARVTAINVFAFTEPLDDAIDEITVNMLDADKLDLFVLGTSARFFSAASAFARDDFQCVEVLLQVDDTAGRARIEVDNVAVLTAEGFDTALPAGIGRFALGIDYTGLDQPGTTVEIDDFVLAREELAGCP
jgi:hypothetical protein